jgi:hypothetical protein
MVVLAVTVRSPLVVIKPDFASRKFLGEFFGPGGACFSRNYQVRGDRCR